VPAAYERIISRAVYMLQHYQRTLARFERRLKEEGVLADSEAMREVLERTANAVRPRWFALEHDASRAAAEFLDRPAALRAAKEYTETAVTQLLLGSPMHCRSYQKPLGYPGDYQTMLYSYANDFEGESLFGKVMHKMCVEHPLALGVRTRKDFIAQMMQEEHDRALSLEGDRLEYKVSSLGCGPAREVAEFVARRRSWPGTALWTLIDQEEQTLSVAFRDCQRALSQTGAHGQVSCLNLSFGQLLADPSLLSAAPRQHFIYSTGLFDYLPEQRAQAVVSALYERLEPGGVLAIGNAVTPNTHVWTLEFLLDWTLLYRTEDEMRRLASKLPAGAQISVAPEPSGAYLFLLARKG
jgi:SAM-dependent methyltransferase